jgi:outer membrane lipoprotein-sorting protein
MLRQDSNRMIVRPPLAVLFMVVAFLLAGFTQLSSEELLVRLQQAAKDVRTIHLPFTQEKHLELFDETITTTGVIDIDRQGGRLRWEFSGHAVFVYDDGHLRKWDADGREETGLDRDPNLAALKAQMQSLVTGDWSTIEALFEVSSEVDPPTLHLTPHEAALARYVASLTIVFRADVSAPQRLELVATGGDSTIYTFAEPGIDVAIDPARFTGP